MAAFNDQISGTRLLIDEQQRLKDKFVREFNALKEVERVARRASCIIDSLELIFEDNELWYARDIIDISLQKLDKARQE